MLVAAIDSSFWLISAQDDVLGRYERRFESLSTPSDSLDAWLRVESQPIVATT
jgi:hypothetical protein